MNSFDILSAQTFLSARDWLSRGAAAFGNLVLPPLCLSCNARIETHGSLCSACWPEIQFIEPPFCSVSGLPFPYDPGPGLVSAAALANPPPYTLARAAMCYGTRSAELVHRFKYSDRMEAVPSFARWMHRAGKDALSGADLIAPVPLHRRRLFSRRFNQSAELARALSPLTGLTFAPRALERVRATKPQVGLSGSARRRNVAGAFRLRKGAGELVKGRIVVLVDDVMTTGATIEACSKALIRAGAKEVRVLCLLRVVPDEGVTI